MVLLSSMTSTLTPGALAGASLLTEHSPNDFVSTLRVRARVRSDLHHFEIFFSRAAFRTCPVHRHGIPRCSWSDTMFRVPRCLVVDPSTDQAHPGPRLGHRFGHFC